MIAALAPTVVPAAHAAQPGNVEKCAFVQGERAHCVQVGIDLPTVPEVGGTAAISVEVAAQADVGEVAVTVDLPTTLRWDRAPEGFSTARVTGASPEAGGAVERASGALKLHSGQKVSLTGTVVAVAPGAAPVRAAVVGATRGQLDTASGSLAVTVGATRAESFQGYREAEVNAATAGPAVAVTRATPHLPHKSVGTAGLAKPAEIPADQQAQALTCVRGSWRYQDQNSQWHPSANFQVQLWRRTFVGPQLLTSDITDENGAYRVCSTAAAGADVYVRFVAENGKWSVVDGDNDPYAFVSRDIPRIGNGATVDLGALNPVDGNLMRALHAFDEVNDAKNWTPGDCWDARHTNCRVVQFRWTPTSTEGAFYRTEQNRVYLRADDPNFRSVVVHELGHAVMDEVYEDNYPRTENCSPHFLHRISHQTCAWTEGFADWYQAAVFNDPRYVGGPGFEVPLETPTWGSTLGTENWDNGDAVEGRVAGALIDLADQNPERYWDSYGEGAPNRLWETFLNHRSTTFNEYWRQRGQDQFDVSDGPQGSLYQSTIDYDYRNPLADNQALTRPEPTTPHNYRFRTTTVFWSAVAVRPPTGARYDLTVFGNRELNQQLASSTLGPDIVNFVAIDSNRRPLGEYFPQVRAVSGHGEYQIQLAQGASQLPPASSAQIAMGANDVVAVRDVCGVTPQQRITLTATPSDGGQDAELFLLASNPDQPASFVQNRAAAVAQAGGQGPGQPETLTHEATSTGCYGVVLVNRGGAGVYTLSRA
ncbi:hypothetical protein ABZ816_02600 [Actinosynnema sp. NPDC047251]|uniref:hypothetical protein n=1 Tax=Saccharothrix espanaensis TaxID=103731 RepID=UPI0011DE311B|nr:hypothetical protein [Saccharothrix espanaensis]